MFGENVRRRKPLVERTWLWRGDGWQQGGLGKEPRGIDEQLRGSRGSRGSSFDVAPRPFNRSAT